MKHAYLWIPLGLVCTVLVGWFGLSPAPETADAKLDERMVEKASEPAGMVRVAIPELGEEFAVGARAFKAKCAACHGPTAGGIEGAGPPLVHVIYEPSHHADVAFFRAAEMGVRAHHWTFGNMLPVEGITRAEIGEIVAYLRAVQRANGIY